MALRYASQSACESREAADCTSALAASLNGNTPDAVEGCAGAYAGWDCADYLGDENIPTACRQQLGPVANGGGCAVDGQCQSGFCATAPGAPCGACAAPPKAGGSCAELTSCGPGLVCTQDTFACVAPGVRGSACGKGAVCGAGLSCVGASPATEKPGTCAPAGEHAGAPCDPTLAKGTGCDRDAGLVCSATSHVCEPLVVAAIGQACGGDVGGQPVDCEAEGICVGAMAAKPGTCKAAAADGAPCDAVHGPGCELPARCIGRGGTTSGTCQYSGAQSCHP
jgi:hypothetical protein